MTSIVYHERGVAQEACILFLIGFCWRIFMHCHLVAVVDTVGRLETGSELLAGWAGPHQSQLVANIINVGGRYLIDLYIHIVLRATTC